MNQMQMMVSNQNQPQQASGLTDVARRKLIADVRTEIKPLIAQIADAQIDKATQILKVQIRKLENELNEENYRLNDKIEFEIKETK